MSDEVSWHDRFAVPGGDRWENGAPTAGGRALREGMESIPGVKIEHVGDALVVLGWIERSWKMERVMLIAQARHEGLSWSQIANLLGESKQNLHAQHRALVDELTVLATTEPTQDDELSDYVDRHFPDAWTPFDW